MDGVRKWLSFQTDFRPEASITRSVITESNLLLEPDSSPQTPLIFLRGEYIAVMGGPPLVFMGSGLTKEWRMVHSDSLNQNEPSSIF